MEIIALAVGSTSTAVILATGSFGPAILDMGTSSLSAAVMVHTGATVIDITAVDVEPTAKPIKIPEIGAKKVPEIPITEIKWTICVDKSETIFCRSPQLLGQLRLGKQNNWPFMHLLA
jgi:hypothetical protein